MDFSVGFNGIVSDLYKIIELNAPIESVYSGGIAGYIAGGRPQYLGNFEEISKCTKVAHANGLKYEVALNAPCGLENKNNRNYWIKIHNYLIELERCGVDRIIASHPFFIEEVKKYTNMQCVASTICEINSARMAQYYEEIGADIIIPSMNINFDMKVLKKIKKILKKAKLRIMVNEHCLGDCPWRRFHHNHYSHHNEEIDYHFHCKKKFLTTPFLLLTNNCIRLEDLKHYTEITNNFKIVGRLVDIEILCKRIQGYAECKWNDNYVELFDNGLAKKIMLPNDRLESLFQMKVNCDKVCGDCGYCKRLYDEIKSEP